MSWKDRLLPASFRGIPFFVESHTHSGGRNFKRHEMPGQDGSFNEDLGKKTDGYTIEAYVLGDNYFFIRDALITAMKAEDAGLLIHPYLTPISVQPEGFTLKENNKSGRIAFLSLQFGEAGNSGFPLAVIDAVVAFANTAVTAIAAVSNAFETTYAVAGLPAYVLDSSVDTLSSFGDVILGALTTVKTDPDERAKLVKKIREFQDDKESTSKSGETLAEKSSELILALADTVAPPENSIGRDDRLTIYTALINFDGGSSRVPVTTVTRQAQKDNLEAIEKLIRGIALIRYAQQAVDIEFDSVQEALRVREEIYFLIETQLGVVSDEEFQAFVDLQAGLVKALPGETIGNEKQVEVQKQSAIVLAYDLFGDLESYEDIILRNNVADPSEISGTIEVVG